MNIILANLRQFITSVAGVRIMVRKANPVRPPRPGRGRTPDHVCPPARERVVLISRECEQALLKALDAFPAAKSTVADVLHRFMKRENKPCAT